MIKLLPSVELDRWTQFLAVFLVVTMSFMANKAQASPIVIWPPNDNVENSERFYHVLPVRDLEIDPLSQLGHLAKRATNTAIKRERIVMDSMDDYLITQVSPPFLRVDRTPEIVKLLIETRTAPLSCRNDKVVGLEEAVC